MRRPIALACLVAALAGPLTGCGSEPVTKEQFVDHAVKMGNPDSAKAEQALRDLFGCAWAEVQKDQDLVSDFMAAESSNDGLSAAISPYLGKCAVGSSK